jgi:hypothetical protein
MKGVNISIILQYLDEASFRCGSNEIEQSYWMRAINWTHDFQDERVQDQKSGKSNRGG